MIRAMLMGLLLAACEDNEHPFEDAWSVSCTVPDFPVSTVAFTEPRALDDSGRIRAYQGYAQASTFRAWIWEVEIDVRAGTAETTSLDMVPSRAHQDQLPIELNVETYTENEETTAATMTGTCQLGDTPGDLVLQQTDNCDLCPDCSVVGVVPSFTLVIVGLLGLRRYQRPRADPKTRWPANPPSTRTLAPKTR
jgi:hypothetical protein